MSSVVFGYLCILNIIRFFLVDLFLLWLWLRRLELFLKCSYVGPKIEARCSYKIVLIKIKRILQYLCISRFCGMVTTSWQSGICLDTYIDWLEWPNTVKPTYKIISGASGKSFCIKFKITFTYYQSCSRVTKSVTRVTE